MEQKRASIFSLIDKENKTIFLISAIIASVIFVLALILTLLSVLSYQAILTFATGYLVGCAMHYLTIVAINKSEVSQYKAIVTKLFMIRQLIYLISLICSYILTKNILPFIFCLVGILVIKISIYLSIKFR